jgi:hypothetical protein
MKEFYLYSGTEIEMIIFNYLSAIGNSRNNFPAKCFPVKR